MPSISKKRRAIQDKLPPEKKYTLQEALQLVKQYATAKFDETVDVSIMLGIDPNKSDQMVRGATVMPNGTGRTVKVAVFAQGHAADEAKAAGADKVGYEDLAEAMKAGDVGYGVVIATPDAMRLVGQLGQVLGPKGLMPNPKLGTVTPNVAQAVKNAKSGQVRFRTDKGGIVHCCIGKASFTAEALQKNFEFLMADIKKAKPANTKGMGVYIKKITLSSTMGPGFHIEQGS